MLSVPPSITICECRPALPASTAATAVAAALKDKAGRKSDIVMDGGTLSIEWRESDKHVYMTGPAEFVFDGEIEI